MSDLISRSTLMSHIESERRQWGDDYDVEQILGDIEDAPTAYDTDKVVEQIENDEKHTFDGCINKRYAIEIVKGGGVNGKEHS